MDDVAYMQTDFELHCLQSVKLDYIDLSIDSLALKLDYMDMQTDLVTILFAYSTALLI